jgi:hypothetical protein
LLRVFELTSDEFQILKRAEKGVHHYWKHIKSTPSHQSNGFKVHRSEHFGTYGLYAKFPYNSGDYMCTTSCTDHRM